MKGKLLLIERMLLGVLLSVVLVSAGFAAQPAPVKDAQTLTLGMIAYSEASTQYKNLEPLAVYLGKKLNAQVHIKLYNDYAGILNDIDHESLHLAILSPIVYALCMDDSSLTFLATSQVKDKPFYHSVIIARKDSSLLSVKDLVGKKVGFVDRYSASGYLYPAAFLKSSGLMNDQKPLYTPLFLGSHERAVRALLEKQVDAAITYDYFFEFVRFQVGEVKNLSLADFRILKLLPERIPDDAVVCRSDLDKKMIQNLKTALLEFEKEKKQPESPLKDLIYSGFKAENRPAYEEVKTFVQGIIGQE